MPVDIFHSLTNESINSSQMYFPFTVVPESPAVAWCPLDPATLQEYIAGNLNSKIVWYTHIENRHAASYNNFTEESLQKGLFVGELKEWEVPVSGSTSAGEEYQSGWNWIWVSHFNGFVSWHLFCTFAFTSGRFEAPGCLPVLLCGFRAWLADVRVVVVVGLDLLFAFVASNDPRLDGSSGAATHLFKNTHRFGIICNTYHCPIPQFHHENTSRQPHLLPKQPADSFPSQLTIRWCCGDLYVYEYARMKSIMSSHLRPSTWPLPLCFLF